MEETRKNKERFAWPETIWSDANILETIKVLALAEISSWKLSEDPKLNVGSKK